MLKSYLVLPDGSELSSGSEGTAIQNAELSCSVNTGTELAPGAVCADMLRLTILAPDGLGLEAGQQVQFYQTDSASNRLERGSFFVEKPTAAGRFLYKLTAFDPVSRLDKDLTEWVDSLSGWPYSLHTFAEMVCQACGLTLATEEIPNGSFPVGRFSAQGITGRQLMQWVGQLAGRFSRADAQGNVVLDWYKAGENAVAARVRQLQSMEEEENLTLILPELTAVQEGEELNLSPLQTQQNADELVLLSPEFGQQFYYSGSFSAEDYEVAPVEKVQIKRGAEDLGAVYPDEPGQKNTWILSGNLLLSAADRQQMEQLAKSLYSLLSTVTYTPCSLTVPAEANILPGTILTVTDDRGNTRQMYVMSAAFQGQRLTLKATGSPSRDSTWAVNEQIWQSTSGKVLNLQADVDGLKVENADTKGNLAKLDLRLGNISSTVQQQEETIYGVKTQLTQVEQTATGLSLRISSVEENGVDKVQTGMGYTFDDNGLHIKKPGQQMENRLDHTGMTVERSGEVMLRADKDGVLATDVKVRNYLIIGSNARLEDYEGGTGCFWVGG